VDGFQSVDTVDTAHSMVLAPSRPLAPRSGAEENSQALPDVRRGPARAKRALPPPPTVPPALHSNGRPPKAAHKVQGVVAPAHVVQVVQVARTAQYSTLTSAVVGGAPVLLRENMGAALVSARHVSSSRPAHESRDFV
jgi:hypothetical protein